MYTNKSITIKTTQNSTNTPLQILLSSVNLFLKYTSQSSEFLCVSNADSFIAGFRLGARFTYDTFIEKQKG